MWLAMRKSCTSGNAWCLICRLRGREQSTYFQEQSIFLNPFFYQSNFRACPMKPKDCFNDANDLTFLTNFTRFQFIYIQDSSNKLTRFPNMVKHCNFWNSLCKNVWWYQDSGQWDKALEIAENGDRIHLRSTFYNYGKHLVSIST